MYTYNRGTYHVRLALPQTREHALLRWLNFRQMTWRYEEVPLAFQKTFQWIFETGSNPKAVWDDFRANLIRPDIVHPYWIDGKAGSGKSTLMKFIVDNPSTIRCLERWADGGELITMKFFFWNLGTTLQKSNAGMLRALLLAVLEKHPELIPAVFPTLYQTWDESDAKTEPSYIELKKAFALLIEKSCVFVKLCIFVDGIDEFEGDHKDVSVFLRSLASAQVKVVVSSRPITACVNVFVTARLSLTRYLRAYGAYQSMNYVSIYVVVTQALEGWRDGQSNVSLHERSDTLLFLLQNVARPEDVGLDGSLWQHATDIGDYLLLHGKPVQCAELLRVFLMTAHSRRALILKKVPVAGTKVHKPMTLIRQIKGNSSKINYDGFVGNGDVSFLGNELERVAFSRFANDDVSQQFLDIVSRVNSFQRVSHGKTGVDTARGTRSLGIGYRTGQPIPRTDMFEIPIVPQGRNCAFDPQMSSAAYRNGINITSGLENLSIAGQGYPFTNAISSGPTNTNMAYSSGFRAPQNMVFPCNPPAHLSNFGRHYSQGPRPAFVPTGDQGSHPFYPSLTSSRPPVFERRRPPGHSWPYRTMGGDFSPRILQREDSTILTHILKIIPHSAGVIGDW